MTLARVLLASRAGLSPGIPIKLKLLSQFGSYNINIHLYSIWFILHNNILLITIDMTLNNSRNVEMFSDVIIRDATCTYMKAVEM